MLVLSFKIFIISIFAIKEISSMKIYESILENERRQILATREFLKALEQNLVSFDDFLTFINNMEPGDMKSSMETSPNKIKYWRIAKKSNYFVNL